MVRQMMLRCTGFGLPTVLRRVGAVLMLIAVCSSCGWRGIANVPLPGEPGTGRMTIYVQMPNTLALNVNSRVRVADVFVGSVRAIKLVNWVATLTLGIDSRLQLPANTLATIGQTSLLGSQHVQLGPPADPSPRELRNGDTIPLQNSSAFPTTERVLASIGTILTGGGIPNLEKIETEVANILTGRGDQIREFLARLDTFTAQLNSQRDDIARAVDSTNRLLAIVSRRNDVLDHALTEFPPLIEHFARTRDLFSGAVQALGRFSKVTNDTLSAAKDNLHEELQDLQRPLTQLARSTPYLVGALSVMLTIPFSIDNVPKVVRGDYVNISGLFDLTLSNIDNSLLSGTRFSGALRALEQAWGRDPATMIPDVRYTPNPHDAPSGPLVERGE